MDSTVAGVSTIAVVLLFSGIINLVLFIMLMVSVHSTTDLTIKVNGLLRGKQRIETARQKLNGEATYRARLCEQYKLRMYKAEEKFDALLSHLNALCLIGEAGDDDTIH